MFLLSFPIKKYFLGHRRPPPHPQARLHREHGDRPRHHEVVRGFESQEGLARAGGEEPAGEKCEIVFI